VSLPDEPAVRRPVFLPVLIAAVCLSIIGASFGYVLSVKIPTKQDPVAAGSTPTGTPSPSAVSTPPVPSASTGRPTPAKPSKPAAKPSAGLPAQCPEVTRRSVLKAGGAEPVVPILRLRTNGGTLAYICQADSGEMYYHASRETDVTTWVNGENALFLPDVEEKDGTYVAKVVEKDGSTTIITVSAALWTIDKKGEPFKTESAVAG
jgi:hypothetical protein